MEKKYNLHPIVFYVGLTIWDLRTSQSLIQEELAEEVGVTQEYLSMIESGKRDLNVNTLKQISLSLGVENLADLIEKAERLIVEEELKGQSG